MLVVNVEVGLTGRGEVVVVSDHCAHPPLLGFDTELDVVVNSYLEVVVVEASGPRDEVVVEVSPLEVKVVP